MVIWTVFIWLRIGHRKYDDEPSVSIPGREYLG
jgi:hypothetical protein